MGRRFSTLAAAALLGACGGAAMTGDAGPMDGGATDASSDAPRSDGAPPDASCTTDADGDGHRSITCGGDDCDDTDPSAYPGNAEICDGLGHDEDCDPTTLGPDRDGDTFVSTMCCDTQATGSLLCGTDCDDLRATVSPSALEACNGADDNCDGLIDNGVVDQDFYPDCDGDGFATTDASAMHVHDCSAPTTPPTGCSVAGASPGWSPMTTDCDDTHATVHPGSTESCNALDDNCNGMIDEGAGVPYYGDCDHDTFGSTTTMTSCSAPTTPPTCATGAGSWTLVPGDCDDAVATTHPTAAEICNGVDDDCNTVVDDEPAATTGCALPHATATCTAGACTTSTCDPSFASCDANPLNGCEADTVHDALNCGSCHDECAWSCIGSACTLDRVVAVVAGTSHTCALLASGEADCWGDNTYGQLGDGTTTNRSRPTPTVGATDYVELAAAGDHTCGRRLGGAVLCWGANGLGQLGDGTTSNRASPTPVSGMSSFSTADAIATGIAHTCARQAGTVYCWGDDAYGGIGDGTMGTVRLIPTAVVGLGASPPGDIAVGDHYACTVLADHTVRCWGRNFTGQLGNGTTVDTATPSAVSGITTAVDVAAGGENTCAHDAAGILSCWGRGSFGAVGDGTTTDRLVPAATGITDARDTVIGDVSVCARHVSGAVSCWGFNGRGDLGDGTTTDRSTPTPVSGLSSASALGSGQYHVCAVVPPGRVACWGADTAGQLGDGATTDRSTPVTVTR